MNRIALALLLALSSCSSRSPDDTRAGSGVIHGQVEGLALACKDGVSIARSFPPTTEIKISPGGVTCGTVQGGDRVTIDLGDARVGTYTIVRGYPSKSSLSRDQARAHACPAKVSDVDPPCHDLVLSGDVRVTRYDPEPGGRIEGTFRVSLADGDVTGAFSAVCCN